MIDRTPSIRSTPLNDDTSPELRAQLLINAVSDYAIYMLDANGHVATWNPGAKLFKGYEPQEIIGRHFSCFFTDEDREAGVPAMILRTAAEQGRFEAEAQRVRKDGSRFWAHVVVDAILGEDGGLIGFAKITRDVTERHEANEALFRSEQRFRLLVQGVRDYAIYMLDPTGIITNWNSGAEAMKGYLAPEIVGQHFSRFYTEEDRNSGLAARALATALREGKYEAEARRVRKDGSLFWAHVVIDPIYDEAGELAGFAKITRDITERRRAEEELEAAKAALFQSQKLQALGELTGGIAHDFNNLMTVIRGSAELLERDGLPDDKRRRYARAILDTADRASTLTSHLLAFGRRQALRPEVVNINVRLDALAEVLGRTLGSGIDISLDLDPNLPPVEVDPAQLETALLNAAFNARDAMEGRGRLTLSTRHLVAEQAVCVAIEDDGPGMAADVLERVFEPFFTTKPVGKGTGLGLSQIHGFAAQTGGRCDIRSAPGEGTTLHLILPATAKPAEDERDRETVGSQPTGRKILLVEDNVHVRQFAEGLIEEMGNEVLSVDCGEKALELLEREKVSLVFSDIVMPGMSGIQLAQAVREKWPGLPILLATGYSEEVINGSPHGLDIVRKPYGQLSLGAAIEDVVAHASAAKAGKSG